MNATAHTAPTFASADFERAWSRFEYIDEDAGLTYLVEYDLLGGEALAIERVTVTGHAVEGAEVELLPDFEREISELIWDEIRAERFEGWC